MRAPAIFITLLFATPAFAQLPWDLLKDRAFRSAYYQALGQKRGERWLAELPGPSSPATSVSLDGSEYLVIHSCKPHACDTNNVVLLYSKKQRAVLGKLFEEGKVTWLGKANAAEKRFIAGAYSDRFTGKS